MTVHIARRARLALAAALVAAALGACTEKLESGAACPALCPSQNVPVRDTVLAAAVVVDTTLGSYPARGDETFLLVADRGADLQSRAVVRFDTLTRKFNRSATDTAVAITQVFNSSVRLVVDSAGSRITAPITVSVYDVDTNAPDADDASVLALFTASRLVGSATFAAADAKDSLHVPISDAFVASRIVNNQRLRLGFAVTGAEPTQLKIYSTAAGSTLGPVLRYDPTVTTDSVAEITAVPRSATPAGLPTVASSLRDYTIVVGGPRPLDADAIAVGGLPARRSYLRFDVPLSLLDSATIVRATLLLTQRPAPGVDPDTAVRVIASAVLAGTDVTDIGRASNVLAADSSYNVTTLALTPGGSGLRSFELGSLLRSWRTVAGRRPVQHAVVIRSGSEGLAAGDIRFYSTAASADTLRPRLRVTYVPRVDFGVP